MVEYSRILGNHISSLVARIGVLSLKSGGVRLVKTARLQCITHSNSPTCHLQAACIVLLGPGPSSAQSLVLRKYGKTLTKSGIEHRRLCGIFTRCRWSIKLSGMELFFPGSISRIPNCPTQQCCAARWFVQRSSRTAVDYSTVDRWPQKRPGFGVGINCQSLANGMA